MAYRFESYILRKMESKLIRWLDLFAKQWVGKTLGIVFSAFRNKPKWLNNEWYSK